jgi:hypothetical protein
MFLENNNDYNYLENGVISLLDNIINIDILIVLLQNKIITGDFIIEKYQLISYIFKIYDSLEHIDGFYMTKIKKFIELCLESGGDINALDEDNEIVYHLIFEYISVDYFDELLTKYKLKLNYNNNNYCTKNFLVHLKTKHPTEYQKYLSQKKAKKFNL